jgi:demethylmenaquinone methyltransferase / 2-methoxy-6-polyprenyl-1,4-benzoquinol methylase
VTAAELPVGEHKAQAVEAMFDRIAPRYELVNRVITLGLDGVWRRRVVRELGLPRGARVLDLGCGTGDLCRELRRAGYRALGVDMAAGMLAHARTASPLFRADMSRLPFGDASADGVVSGFALRNVVDLGACLREAARVLRPGGRAVLLEVSEPDSRVLHALHTLYFRRIVPIIGGALSDAAAYRYLPASTSYLPPPAALLHTFRDAGFDDGRHVSLTGGAAQLLIGTRS